MYPIRAKRHWVKNLLWLGSGIVLYLVPLMMIRHETDDLEFLPGEIRGQLRTPILTIRLKKSSFPKSKDSSRRGMPALLVHGVSASKSAMIQLGVRLAHRGIECHLLDLPGHGSSVERFSPRAGVQAVREVIDATRRANPGRSAELLVIGHSLGGSLALDAARGDDEVTVIGLSPAAAPLTPEVPRRLLLIIGQYDLPTVRRGAAFMFERATGILLPSPLSPGSWRSPTHSKELVVLPGADHTSTALRSESSEQISKWLMEQHPESRLLDPDHSEHLLWRLVSCSCLLLIFLPAFHLAADLIEQIPGLGRTARTPDTCPTHGTPNPPADRSKIRRWLADRSQRISPLGSYALASLVGVIILSLVNPWKSLHLLGGGFLTGFLCLAGLTLLILKWPQGLSLSVADLLKVFVAVGIIAFWLGPELSNYFVHLSWVPSRLWRIPLITLSVLPFFLADEWVCRKQLKDIGTLNLWFFHLSSRFLMALAWILGFFVLTNGEFLILLVLPATIAFSVLGWFYCEIVYEQTQSVAASAWFGALLSGWFISAFFAQV